MAGFDFGKIFRVVTTPPPTLFPRATYYYSAKSGVSEELLATDFTDETRIWGNG
jgi:hypothetical protein